MADDATKKIIRGLARYRPRNQIIKEISEKYRISWEDAERLLEKVELDHLQSIQFRWRPFYILLGGLLTIGGLSLASYILFAAADGIVISFFEMSISQIGYLVLFISGLLSVISGALFLTRVIRRK